MKYLKNALFVAMFALLSFSMEAVAPFHSFSSTQITANAWQGEGIVHIVQARNSVKVDVITTGIVNLTVVDSEGNVVYNRSLTPQARRANISTTNFANGVYLLIAEASGEVQEESFTVGETK